MNAILSDHVTGRTFAGQRQGALTSSRLNDIVKSHTKPQVGWPFFFFSLGADGESACNSIWAKAQRQCFAAVDYSERQGCNGSYK